MRQTNFFRSGESVDQNLSSTEDDVDEMDTGWDPTSDLLFVPGFMASKFVFLPGPAIAARGWMTNGCAALPWAGGDTDMDALAAGNRRRRCLPSPRLSRRSTSGRDSTRSAPPLANRETRAAG